MRKVSISRSPFLYCTVPFRMCMSTNRYCRSVTKSPRHKYPLLGLMYIICIMLLNNRTLMYKDSELGKVGVGR